MRHLRALVPAALALALASCGSSDPTAPSVSLTGTYTLQTVNGSTLPFTLASGAVLVGDHLTVNGDGTYADVTQYAAAGGGYTSQTEYGTYDNNNGAITFNDQTDNISYQASLSGSVLTEIVAGLTEAYKKD